LPNVSWEAKMLPNENHCCQGLQGWSLRTPKGGMTNFVIRSWGEIFLKGVFFTTHTSYIFWCQEEQKSFEKAQKLLRVCMSQGFLIMSR
jgi:hypothetical protein